MKMLQPFIKEHEDNINAAIRDVIEPSSRMTQCYGMEDAKVRERVEKEDSYFLMRIHIPIARWLILGIDPETLSFENICEGLKFTSPEAIFDEFRKNREKWMVNTTLLLKDDVIYIKKGIFERLIRGDECPGGVDYIERRSGIFINMGLIVERISTWKGCF
ncbi:MAG: hypothetical protein ACXQTD_09345 [Candidatus Syntropharchaeia archaeon]